MVQESRDQQLLSCKDALKPRRQKEMKPLRKKKIPRGVISWGKEFGCYHAGDLQTLKAMKSLVSRTQDR